ncbi:hypothetical protein OM076_29020 [Solirubrobacter ginsenosidimutans]|uniref:Uncharacterized protein n=1 Tax=Solirubrobacter ginsenosidimutans TaxID=490573 RepID=A0A9X3N019_9ACTN|nr:hypothetical protein [Solirubrobacter ginsenosidimutans]MDA0164347.1 hypothetical protein [Solirubrobacter ginsenosidimutans]
MNAPRITRAALWILAAEAAVVAVPALLAPRYFYDSFPFGASWVDRLPPFNRHLVSDVGGFYLAFALLFAWAAVTLRRALIVPLCSAWGIAALVHFIYHVTHLDGWDAGDAIAQTVSLAIVLALPAVAIAAAPQD